VSVGIEVQSFRLRILLGASDFRYKRRSGAESGSDADWPEDSVELVDYHLIPSSSIDHVRLAVPPTSPSYSSLPTLACATSLFFLSNDSSRISGAAHVIGNKAGNGNAASI
jgi:hypothetical protein